MINKDFQTAKLLFEKCGGSIYNIKRAKGENGIGLFANKESKFSAIFTPETLTLDIKNIVLVGGKIRIREECRDKGDKQNFFDFYIQKFLKTSRQDFFTVTIFRFSRSNYRHMD